MPYFRGLFALEPVKYRDISFPFIIRCLFVCSTNWTSILGYYLCLISSCDAGGGSDSTQTFFLYSFLAGNLIVGIGEVLEINTTAPSIVNNNCSSCNYNASHEKRSSSHGEHLAAVIRFSGNIEFRNGSTVQVFGKYGLSITSQNGHILIETDINMTCTEMVLDETCLGGFTQSSLGKKDKNTPPKFVYKGKRICFYFPFLHLHLVCCCFYT